MKTTPSGARERALPTSPELSTTWIMQELAAVTELVADDATATLARWQPAIRRASFHPAASNLAHYLALRRHDLSRVQQSLSELGLSSLGRSEARVMDSLTAVMATLARLEGGRAPDYPAVGWSTRGGKALRKNTERIFGKDPTGPRTRIMVTLSREMADDARTVHRIIEAGADCARINCAHDSPEIWTRMVAHVRTAAAALGRDCRVLMDLAGPKCRVTGVSARNDRGLRVKEGDAVHLLGAPDVTGNQAAKAFSIAWPAVVGRLGIGQPVSVDDGKVDMVVEAADERGLRMKVLRTRSDRGKIRVGKSVNFPGFDLGIDALTQKDLQDLESVLKHADIVGYSFVQTADDVRLLQAEIRKRAGRRPMPSLMLKIETRRAVENLPELLVAAAGRQPTAVMIARGDLAVELGLDRLSELQEQILWLCEAAHVPVVWATQVLEGLVKKRSPTRAEASDAALSQRAECVMLNKGPYIVEAVAFLDDILRRMDRHMAKRSPVLGPLQSWRGA